MHGALDEPPILEDTRWAVVLDACRRVYAADLDPLEVTFWHPEPESGLEAFLEYFRCPLRFGEPVASMTFPAGVLDKRLPAASRELAKLSTRKKNVILEAMAEELDAQRAHIQAENAKDLAAGRENGLSSAMLDRLELTDDRIDSMIYVAPLFFHMVRWYHGIY